MTHYGFMAANTMPEAEAALMHARRYLRSGKQWMQTGIAAAGIAALYDSVLYGMHYYVARHEACTSFVAKTDLWDAVALYHALARAGVFDELLTFNRLSLMVERTLWQGPSLADGDITLNEVENLLTQLGVIPFNEAALNGPSLNMT